MGAYLFSRSVIFARKPGKAPDVAREGAWIEGYAIEEALAVLLPTWLQTRWKGMDTEISEPS